VTRSTARPEISYQPDGYNRFTMIELMRPIDATAHLCGLRLAEPLVLHGARTVSDQALTDHSRRYRDLLARHPVAQV
jgi:glutathione-regulated potassium-efflux system ancillary protein KefG